jgi:hypothetical protein
MLLRNHEQFGKEVAMEIEPEINAFDLYGLDFQLILLRQAEIDLTSFQWRYRELDDACGVVEHAKKKIQAMISKIESRQKP